MPGAARDDTFVIRPSSTVYGGFAGNETSRAERDPVDHVTTLSGDMGTPGDASDNSYHVVTIDGTTSAGTITASTVLDGFTIRDGNANGPFPATLGVGLYCTGAVSGRNGDPTLAQLRFVNNAASYGGAITLRADGYGSASPNLTDVVFLGNSAARYGGAIYVWTDLNGVASPTIARATFNGNSADKGGAIYNGSGSSGGTANATISNATFQGNDASIGSSIGNGGAIYNHGLSGSAAMTLTNVTFSGNTANGSNHIGGAMVNEGSVAMPRIVNAIFWGDQASNIAEIYNTVGAQPTVSNSIIQGGRPAGANCTSVQDADPLIGALAANGGFSPTLLPAAGSPAIDAGDAAACAVTDQRGVPRPQGTGCDIGAVEVVPPHRCYVNRAASGANSGLDWASAYTELQSALHDSACNEVWVAKGAYKPTSSTTDRTVSFSISPGLKLHGGFAGAETAAAQADPGANRTVLSGDIDGNDTVDADGVTRSYTDAAGANTFTVVVMDGTTSSGSIGADTVLDGFAISAGTGTAGLNSYSVAGALYCNANAAGRSCKPLLTRLWFAGNQAGSGGAVFNRGENGGVASPELRSVTFSGNQATFGAAVANYGYGGTASPILSNVTLQGNVSSFGALFNQASLSSGYVNPTLRNVTFAGNSGQAVSALYVAADGGTSATTLDATILKDVGAPEIACYSNSGTVAISNSVIAGGCPGGQTTCHNILAGDPALGALQDNGGATPTMLPGVRSRM